MHVTTSRPPASNAGRVAAALFLVVALFHFALVAGAPWGEASLGGAHAGVLPDTLRIGSIVSLAFYLLLAAVAGTSWAGATLRRRVLYGAAALMVVGTLLNIASPSFIERIIWAPVTAVLVVSLWQAARHASLAPAPEVTTQTAPHSGDKRLSKQVEAIARAREEGAREAAARSGAAGTPVDAPVPTSESAGRR